jgi:hypothetical protein
VQLVGVFVDGPSTPRIFNNQEDPMSMTDKEKEARAAQRAEDRLQASLVRERQRQADIGQLTLRDEDERKVEYLNIQLLRPERRKDWPFLRETRSNILRFYGREADTDDE